MNLHRKQSRMRRAKKTRRHILGLRVPRMSIHRTPRHIYAQIISPEGDRTLASASTLDKDVRSEVSYGGNRSAASVVGRIVAERAKQAGVERVAFDRSGFKYHGRIKALADAAREAGLSF
nr:50S ribosomal protein L18 [Thioalkalivibrio sp. HK1]